MPPTVRLWSGHEIRALREAKRMSIREFAAHLGVSERMVSKWEAGGEKIHPRPVNQSALDSSLATSSGDDHARFTDLISEVMAAIPAGEAAVAVSLTGTLMAPGQEHQVRHPIDGKLMTLVNAGIFLSGPDDESVYLPAFYIDVFPTTNADYARFVATAGHKPPQHWSDSPNHRATS